MRFVKSERESRLIVDSIPGLVAVFTPGGELEFVNRPIFEYFGKTLEELKHWGTGGMTHPEDLPAVVVERGQCARCANQAQADDDAGDEDRQGDSHEGHSKY